MLRFLILMLAFNALYTDSLGSGSGRSEEATKFKNFIKDNAGITRQVLNRKNDQLHKLIDYVSNTDQHSNLHVYLQTRKGFLNKNSPDFEHFAEFIMKVRNNMFHSVKMWDDQEELRLLSMINPILRDLIEKIIRDANRNKNMRAWMYA